MANKGKHTNYPKNRKRRTDLIPSVDRFWSKVSVRGHDDCWEWLAFCSPEGYGRFRAGSRHNPLQAHRYSFFIATGVMPQPDRCVMHICDNRKCVNPSHLRLGTWQENSADRNNKGRQSRGETHGPAKLKEWEVRQIKETLASGEVEDKYIRLYFGVTAGTLQDIKHGRTWRHVS